jgi:hypothetical protein
MQQQVAETNADGGAGPLDARRAPYERTLRAYVATLDVDGLRRRFREDEILVLDDFVPSPMLGEMIAETRRLMPRARRSHLPFVRKGGAISHPTILAEAPALDAFQASPSLRAFFQTIADGPVLEARKNDPHASAIYTYTERGDHIKWHYDDCGCVPQAAYSIILGLIEQSSCILEAVTFKKSPGRPEVERSIKVSPGTLVFFCGTNVWHRVTPLGRGEERATFSFVYVKEGNHPKGLEKLHLEAMNTLLYFGPKGLFKRTPDR